MDRFRELHNVRLFHLRPFGNFVEKYLEPGMEEHVRCCTAFTGGVKSINQLIKDGRADFYPIPLSKAPWLLRSGPFKPDVFVATMSPPNDRGECNLGISVDYGRAAFESASTVIAEINPNMPRTCGDTKVNVDEIDYFVKSNESIYELPPPKISKLEKTLAEYVTSLVLDGATIQIGYGSISESMAHFLAEKKDLGMHSEMFPESAVDLVDSGVLNGVRKTLNKEVGICAFAAGTKRLYEWLDENERVEFRTFEYTNDPAIIARNYRMTTINSALQVDLFGNIYSDLLGFDQYSGAGGQPDFVIGTQLCPNGVSIIVLPSTAANGKLSRIVAYPNLSINPQSPASPTITRFQVDYVVTEHGIANLKNKNVKERAKALLQISHPEFVEAIRKEAQKIRLLD
jgi:4-hydroxybutyrate CoA-transferase